MSIKEEIVKLSQIWYKIVSLDHHKDRDCHWEIVTRFSYGEEPIYIVEHYGYVFETICKKFKSYENAETGLVKVIKEAIESEQKWGEKVLNNRNEYDEDQIQNAKEIIQIINDYGK